MSVSIIIPTRNQHLILDQALQSIAQSNTKDLGRVEILVIDNQSDEQDSQAYLKNLPTNALSWGLENVSVIDFNEPFNFSKMNNAAVEQARGDVLCFLNNDVEVISEDWLGQLVKEASHRETGCVGALLFYPDNTVQHAGVVMGMGTIADHAYVKMPRESTLDHPYFQEKRICTAITGACLAIRREVFDSVGGFENTLAVAFNDIDLCLKVQKAGYHNIFLPSVKLYHHESVSRGRGNKSPEAKARHQQEIRHMQKTWGASVRSDPHWVCEKNQPTLGDNGFPYLIKRRLKKKQVVTFRYRAIR